MLPQRRNLRQKGEIPIVVKNREIVPESAGGDQAVDSGTNRHSCQAASSIELSAHFENIPGHGRFNHRERQEILASKTKG